MIAEVKLDMKNVVSVVVMQDTAIDGNNGLNKVMNNAVQMGFASIRRRFEDGCSYSRYTVIYCKFELG